MTKSQNTKNEQQKDLCITSEQLTEQWKKGELPEGFYYVNDGAEVTIDYYLCDYWERHFGWDVQQIIAPVPSYDEWKESYNCMHENEVLRLKNAHIKELLKEVKDYLPEFETPMDILAKIDEALR